VRFENATIKGDLHCVGGIFQNPEGDALAADGITVAGSVRLHTRFLAQGAVRLGSARIQHWRLKYSLGRIRKPESFRKPWSSK
jgi:hypothetical protein